MKTILSIFTLMIGLSLRAQAQEFTITYYLSGAWWETRTLSGLTLDAGEIRIWLYSDGVAEAEREFDDQIFDFCDGTWNETRNSFGVVTSVKMSFVSDFAGEVFTLTAKRGKVTGKFASTRVGKVQATFLDPPVEGLKKMPRSRQ
jgi:hypothetical protein